MEWQARDVLEAEIEKLENLLDGMRAALAAWDRKDRTRQAKSDPSAPRFALTKRPIDAMKILLEENGGEMDEAELIESLIENGAFIGKKKPESNAELSIKINIRTGTIRREGSKIVLVGERNDDIS